MLCTIFCTNQYNVSIQDIFFLFFFMIVCKLCMLYVFWAGRVKVFACFLWTSIITNISRFGELSATQVCCWLLLTV